MSEEDIQQADRDAKQYTATDALLDELAKLGLIEYGQRRKEAAKQLGVPLGMLDKEIETRRPKPSVDDSSQGRALDLFEPELWPEAVDGEALLYRLVETFRRFLVLPDHAADAMALWTVFAHAIDGADIAPRLAFISPVKEHS